MKYLKLWENYNEVQNDDTHGYDVEVLSIDGVEGNNTVTVFYNPQESTYFINVIGGDKKWIDTFEGVMGYMLKYTDIETSEVFYNEDFFKDFI